MLRLKRNGQTVIEYALIVTIVAAALLSTQIYIKRAIQGRWKTSVDDLGDQYDPKTANTFIRHSVRQNATTAMRAEIGEDGITTFRTDTTQTSDFKNGTMRAGQY